MNNKYLLVLVTLRQNIIGTRVSVRPCGNIESNLIQRKKTNYHPKKWKIRVAKLCPTCYQFSMSYRKKFLDMNVVYISFTKTACPKK